MSIAEWRDATRRVQALKKGRRLKPKREITLGAWLRSLDGIIACRLLEVSHETVVLVSNARFEGASSFESIVFTCMGFVRCANNPDINLHDKGLLFSQMTVEPGLAARIIIRASPALKTEVFIIRHLEYELNEIAKSLP